MKSIFVRSLGWLLLSLFVCNVSLAFENIDVDWSRNFPIPKEANGNPYQLEEKEFYDSLHRGSIDTLAWPVEVTGILLPVRPIAKFIDGRSDTPLRRWLSSVFAGFSQVESMQDLYDWMGLNEYPRDVGNIESPYYVPTPPGQGRTIPMGVGFIERNGAKGITFSCATCHSSKLFGKKVIGLSNRFMRANSIFVKGKKASKHAHDWMFHLSTDATKAERKMFQQMRENINFVGVKDPVVLGLDTSLAQVSLSLARRAKDAYATKDKRFARRPRKEKLS